METLEAKNDISVNETLKKEVLFESDVDRAIYEVYGKTGLEEFNDLYKNHPEWTSEQVLKEFESKPINPQTYFFRSGNLEIIAEQLAPQVETKEKERPVKILEIGCSTGEESYSLAVDMLRAGRDNFHITAVDVSPKLLEVAEKGEYKLHASKMPDGRFGFFSTKPRQEYFDEGYFEISENRWVKRRYVGPSISEIKRIGYFDSEGHKIKDFPDSWYEEIEQPIIRPAQKIKDAISFQKHDVIDGPIEGSFDIILMNNVLLHYPEETREKILGNVLKSLRSGGFLVLEHTIGPMNDRERGWLEPYNEWRAGFADKFNLEEVGVNLYEGEPIKTGQYYRLKKE